MNNDDLIKKLERDNELLRNQIEFARSELKSQMDWILSNPGFKSWFRKSKPKNNKASYAAWMKELEEVLTRSFTRCYEDAVKLLTPISENNYSHWREIDRKKEELECEKTISLYEYLQGKLPEGVTCWTPKLNGKKAFDIIWFLQECLNLVDSKYERCSICGNIYDSWGEGHHSELTGKCYCGSCYVYDCPVTPCDECGEDVYKSKSYSEKDGMYLCKECRKKHRENNDD